MAHYQLRRPSPVTIFPRRVRRDGVATSSAAAESPNSPGSSPSSSGSLSSDSDSDSDDEEHAKEKDEKKQQKSAATSSTPVASTAASTAVSSSRVVQTLGPDSTAASSQIPLASLLSMMSASANTSSMPQITGTTLSTMPRPTITSTVTEIKSQTERKGQSSPTSTPAAPPPSIPTTAKAGQVAPSSFPQQTLPQQEQEQKPIMTNEARIAAIVLGVLGALALLVCVLVLVRRRKRKDRENHVARGPDAFNPSNINSAIASEVNVPDTAHTGAASSVFARLNGGTSGGGDGHITRSTDRSNTLFGAGSYARPETVSTNRSMSRIPPQTPNPFADPPLNKAYDVLNNRPRSTTLTDRGSWMNNPFKNPESERFDPFGELKDKARRERLRYLQEAKREAELQRQMEQKEAMGLRPDGMPLDGQSGYR